MITSRKELKTYCDMDSTALGCAKSSAIRRLCSPVWRFERALRHYEYYYNTRKCLPLLLFWKGVHRHLSMKLGFIIPPNTFGGGLKINHYGLIVVNPDARIGEWCDIHQGVNIGSGYDGVPTIGNNVWIGPGVKVFGKITIADECAIGANAVVNSSFSEPRVTIAGVPAKVVSKKGNQYIRGK